MTNIQTPATTTSSCQSAEEARRRKRQTFLQVMEIDPQRYLLHYPEHGKLYTSFQDSNLRGRSGLVSESSRGRLITPQKIRLAKVQE
jgi:hypothetical protein